MSYPCNKLTLALIVGYSDKTLGEFQKQGMPVLKSGTRGRQNEYDTVDVVRWLEGRARAGRKNNTIDFNEARTLLTERQAEKAMLENAQLRADLIPLASAQAIQASIANAVREQFTAMTSKLLIRFPELPQPVQDELDTLINLALNELSETRLSNQLRATLAGYYERAQAATENLAEPVGS
ncbi:MAG: terminase small subunit [Gammaproteobacteria bacterium]